jgi:hypothetical protein
MSFKREASKSAPEALPDAAEIEASPEAAAAAVAVVEIADRRASRYAGIASKMAVLLSGVRWQKPTIGMSVISMKGIETHVGALTRAA